PVGAALDAGFELLAATSLVMTPPGAPLGPATPSVTRRPKPRPPVSSSVPIDRRRARRGALRRDTPPSPMRCMPLTPFQLRRWRPAFPDVGPARGPAAAPQDAPGDHLYTQRERSFFLSSRRSPGAGSPGHRRRRVRPGRTRPLRTVVNG